MHHVRGQPITGRTWDTQENCLFSGSSLYPVLGLSIAKLLQALQQLTGYKSFLSCSEDPLHGGYIKQERDYQAHRRALKHKLVLVHLEKCSTDNVCPKRRPDVHCCPMQLGANWREPMRWSLHPLWPILKCRGTTINQQLSTSGMRTNVIAPRNVLMFRKTCWMMQRWSGWKQLILPRKGDKIKPFLLMTGEVLLMVWLITACWALEDFFFWKIQTWMLSCCFVLGFSVQKMLCKLFCIKLVLDQQPPPQKK